MNTDAHTDACLHIPCWLIRITTNAQLWDLYGGEFSWKFLYSCIHCLSACWVRLSARREDRKRAMAVDSGGVACRRYVRTTKLVDKDRLCNAMPVLPATSWSAPGVVVHYGRPVIAQSLVKAGVRCSSRCSLRRRVVVVRASRVIDRIPTRDYETRTGNGSCFISRSKNIASSDRSSI